MGWFVWRVDDVYCTRAHERFVTKQQKLLARFTWTCSWRWASKLRRKAVPSHTMTDEANRAWDEQLIAALVVTLMAKHAIESEYESFRILRTLDGRFLVTQKLFTGEEREDLFDDARAAVAYYLDLCELAF
jgi:hypothetical protein